MEVKFTPKIKAHRANLDAQILALPEEIEFTITDQMGRQVKSDCTGFFLNLEDFTGDLYAYTPINHRLRKANVVAFGPMGAGKSSFTNSGATAISDRISYHSVLKY